MTPKKKEEVPKVVEPKALKLLNSGVITTVLDNTRTNPWVTELDRMVTRDNVKEYKEAVQACRFYYRRDPLASVVINKLVDIAISPLKLIKRQVPENQFRVYQSLLTDLQAFAEDCALEYLLSGLLIPEVEFEQVTKLDLESRGVKKLSSLSLPTSMWVRNAESIEINSPLIGNRPSYYLIIPDEVIYFIKNEGRYKDSTSDPDLYAEILKLHPDFVAAIRSGAKKILLENPNIIRRRVLTDSPYPTPFLYPALESLKHKRNLREMDYSIAARVITAIMHIKVGDADFPLVETEEGERNQLDDLQAQMRYRDSVDETEKIFQLFTNHTVDIAWVFPDTAALLDDVKYKNVNMDILNALGFPKILITGESERTQSSDAQIALISPKITMENLREKILVILRRVLDQLAKDNGFGEVPKLVFTPMNLQAYGEFVTALASLYESGNISREDYTELVTNLDFYEQLEKRKAEIDKMAELGVPEFAPQPHSNSPEDGKEVKKNDQKPK